MFPAQMHPLSTVLPLAPRTPQSLLSLTCLSSLSQSRMTHNRVPLGRRPLLLSKRIPPLQPQSPERLLRSLKSMALLPILPSNLLNLPLRRNFLGLRLLGTNYFIIFSPTSADPRSFQSSRKTGRSCSFPNNSCTSSTCCRSFVRTSLRPRASNRTKGKWLGSTYHCRSTHMGR